MALDSETENRLSGGTLSDPEAVSGERKGEDGEAGGEAGGLWERIEERTRRGRGSWVWQPQCPSLERTIGRCRRDAAVAAKTTRDRLIRLRGVTSYAERGVGKWERMDQRVQLEESKRVERGRGRMERE